MPPLPKRFTEGSAKFQLYKKIRVSVPQPPTTPCPVHCTTVHRDPKTIHIYRNDVSKRSYFVLWRTRTKINMPSHTNLNRVSFAGRRARLFISRESDLNAIRCRINGSFIRAHKSWRLGENITIMQFHDRRTNRSKFTFNYFRYIITTFRHLYLLQ